MEAAVPRENTESVLAPGTAAAAVPGTAPAIPATAATALRKAADAPNTPTSTTSSDPSVSETTKRKTPRAPEPHITVLDADELDVAREWAAKAIKDKTGLDILALPVDTKPELPTSPTREGPAATLSNLFRKMLSPSSALATSASGTPVGDARSYPSASSIASTYANSPTAEAAKGTFGSGSGTANPSSLQGVPPAARLFGVPLDVMLQRAPAVTGAYRLRLPAQMHEMLKYLRKAGRVDMDGIFRVSGSAKHIDELHALFIAKPDLDLESVQLTNGVVTTHDVAGLLKLFVRSLPEPLATVQFERLCPVVHQLGSGQERLYILQLFYISLPSANRDCFESLIRFLHRVAREKNKMNATNLALVFAPALLTTAAQQNLQLHQHVVAVLKMIISRYDEIFKPTAWLAVREQVLKARAATQSEPSAFGSVDDDEQQHPPHLEGSSDNSAVNVTPQRQLQLSEKLKRRKDNMASSISGFFTARRGLRRSNTLTESPPSTRNADTAAAVENPSRSAEEPSSAASGITPARSTSVGDRRRRKGPLPAIATSTPPPTETVVAINRSISDNHLIARALNSTTADHQEPGSTEPKILKRWSEDTINMMLAAAVDVQSSSTSTRQSRTASPSLETPRTETLLRRRSTQRSQSGGATLQTSLSVNFQETGAGTRPKGISSAEPSSGAGRPFDSTPSPSSAEPSPKSGTSNGSGTRSPRKRQQNANGAVSVDPAIKLSPVRSPSRRTRVSDDESL